VCTAGHGSELTRGDRYSTEQTTGTRSVGDPPAARTQCRTAPGTAAAVSEIQPGSPPRTAATKATRRPARQDPGS
jgi:hypothetical protein